MKRASCFRLAGLVACTFPGFVFACSSGDAGPSPVPTATTTAPTVTKACTAVSETRCAGAYVETCTADAAGNLSWGTKARCPNPSQVCKNARCSDANPKAVAQVPDMARVTTFLLDYHPWRGPVDEPKVLEDAELALLSGDGSGESFFRVAQAAFRAVPGGHSGIYSLHTPTNETACGGKPDDKIAMSTASWHGVCTSVSGDEIVVSRRLDTANIDLMPGERIVAVRDGAVSYEGKGMLDALGELPICAPTQPFAPAARDVTAASILSLAKPGWILRVKNLAGAERDVTVPARLDKAISCGDSFNRSPGVDGFSVTLRPDGYLVVWLKTFGSTQTRPLPSPLTTAAYKDWVAGRIQDLQTELAKYPSAKGIVWDVRGNTGGSQDLAIALAMGSKAPSQRGGLVKCLARKGRTHPAEFEPTSTPPNGDSTKVLPGPELDGIDALFSYTGKQVVVSNGNIYSASDLFVFAAKKAGLKVVGRSGPGAYGASAGAPRKTLPSFIVEGIPIYTYVSGWSCVDGAGTPIEGNPPAVDVAVELASQDLAAGIDTQVEEAIKVLGP